MNTWRKLDLAFHRQISNEVLIDKNANKIAANKETFTDRQNTN